MPINNQSGWVHSKLDATPMLHGRLHCGCGLLGSGKLYCQRCRFVMPQRRHTMSDGAVTSTPMTWNVCPCDLLIVMANAGLMILQALEVKARAASNLLGLVGFAGTVQPLICMDRMKYWPQYVAMEPADDTSRYVSGFGRLQ